MAIPFNLPTYEETENNYRAMDELFAQLYRVLRQILMRQQEEHVPVPNIEQQRHGRVRHHQPQPQPQEEAEEVDAPVLPDVLPRLPLPDLVTSCSPPAGPTATSAPATSPAPRPDKGAEATLKVEVRDNWTQVGEDLRQIADEFSCASLEDMDSKRLRESSSPKGINFLSLLVPPPFRGSIWMAVIFLFGWQVVQRTR